MSVNRIRKNGTYAPLSAHYFKDEAIIEVGPLAEVIFVRSLAFCSEALSDGFIARNQVQYLTVGVPKPGPKVAELVRVGLWKEAEGGWVVSGWLSWNASKADILGAEAKDRSRKKRQVNGSHPPPTGDKARPDSERIPNGIRTESERLARGGARASLNSTTTQLNSENPPGSPSVAELPPGNPAGRRDDDGRSATLEPGNGEIVAAWIDSYRANGTNPTRNTIAQVGKEIKTLVEAGNNPILVLEAAKQAGAKGFRTIERELGSMNGKLIDTRRFRKPTPTENRDRIAAELDAEMGWPPMRVVNGDG